MSTELQSIVDRIENERKKEEIKRQISEGIIKPLNELVVLGMFTVDEVISQSAGTVITPISMHTPIGGRIDSYNGGQTYTTTLKVTPRLTDMENVSNVHKLNFYGMTPVRNGENILAQMPCYSVIKVYCNPPRPSFRDYPSEEEFYCAREFRPEETAIEISIVDNVGKILRVDRSSDYGRFLPEK